jgi:hypothetical protein
MQDLIDGKLYDTDTAAEIASYSTGGSTLDFGYYQESLYRTENGRWFLAGEGHAKTHYGSTTSDGMRGWGSAIHALSKEQAFQWCQRKGKVDVAREHFADRIEPA